MEPEFDQSKRIAISSLLELTQNVTSDDLRLIETIVRTSSPQKQRQTAVSLLRTEDLNRKNTSEMETRIAEINEIHSSRPTPIGKLMDEALAFNQQRKANILKNEITVSNAAEAEVEDNMLLPPAPLPNIVAQNSEENSDAKNKKDSASSSNLKEPDYNMQHKPRVSFEDEIKKESSAKQINYVSSSHLSTVKEENIVSPEVKLVYSLYEDLNMDESDEEEDRSVLSSMFEFVKQEYIFDASEINFEPSKNSDLSHIINHLVEDSNITSIYVNKSISMTALMSLLQYCFKEQNLFSLNLVNQQFTLESLQLLGSFLLDCKVSCLSLESSCINLERLKEFLDYFNEIDFILFNISENPLTDVGCIRVLETLANSKQLKYLSLAETQAEDGCIRELCSEIHLMKNLEYLDLNDNPGVGRESFQLLNDLLKGNHRLLQLSLVNTGMNAREEAQINRYIHRNQICNEILNDITDAAVDLVENPPSDDIEENLTELEEREIEISRKLEQSGIIHEDFIGCIANKLSIQTKEYFRIPKRVEYFAAVSETMGRREEMEDVQYENTDFGMLRERRLEVFEQETNATKEMLFCLFDGHGGRDCSENLAEILPGLLADHINTVLQTTRAESPDMIPEAAWGPIMTSVFLETDAQLRELKVLAGSTGNVLYICNSLIVSANCGDSRTVLSRNLNVAKQKGIDVEHEISKRQNEKPIDDGVSDASGIIAKKLKPETDIDLKELQEFKELNIDNQSLEVRISKDHKPFDPEEKARIEAAGGYVHNDRLLAVLSVSRSFGDFELKPALSCMPFVSTYHIEPSDLWIMLGCDGVFDVLEDLDVACLMLSCNLPEAASIKLRDEAYRLESSDNISVCCIKIISEW